MSFNESFWVTAGTAAPVIALTNIVAAADGARYVVRHAQDFAMWPSRKDRPDIYATLWVLAINGCALTLQIFVLFGALWSLLDRQNVMTPWLAIISTVGGLILLAVSSTISVTFWTKVKGEVKANPEDDEPETSNS